MAAAAIFKFVGTKIWRAKTVSGTPFSVSVPNFVRISSVATELWVLNEIENGGRVRARSAKWPFKVIVVHWFRYHSKARMQLPSVSYWSSIVTLVLSCPFQRYCRFSVQNSDPTPIPPKFWGVPIGLHSRRCGSEERRPLANYLWN